MIAGLVEMACGGCGNDTYKFYQGRFPDGRLHIECTQCKSVSVIQPQQVKLEIEWGEGEQLGRLTHMPHKK